VTGHHRGLAADGAAERLNLAVPPRSELNLRRQGLFHPVRAGVCVSARTCCYRCALL